VTRLEAWQVRIKKMVLREIAKELVARSSVLERIERRDTGL
jgi:hypothetical protein